MTRTGGSRCLISKPTPSSTGATDPTMRLLLDTAIFIWAMHSPGFISASALKDMQADGAILELGALSITRLPSRVPKANSLADDVLAGLADVKLKVLRGMFVMPSISSTSQTTTQTRSTGKSSLKRYRRIFRWLPKTGCSSFMRASPSSGSEPTTPHWP